MKKKDLKKLKEISHPHGEGSNSSRDGGEEGLLATTNYVYLTSYEYMQGAFLHVTVLHSCQLCVGRRYSRQYANGGSDSLVLYLVPSHFFWNCAENVPLIIRF